MLEPNNQFLRQISVSKDGLQALFLNYISLENTIPGKRISVSMRDTGVCCK